MKHVLTFGRPQVHLHRGVSSGVQNLPSVNLSDGHPDWGRQDREDVSCTCRRCAEGETDILHVKDGSVSLWRGNWKIYCFITDRVSTQYSCFPGFLLYFQPFSFTPYISCILNPDQVVSVRAKHLDIYGSKALLYPNCPASGSKQQVKWTTKQVRCQLCTYSNTWEIIFSLLSHMCSTWNSWG